MTPRAEGSSRNRWVDLGALKADVSRMYSVLYDREPPTLLQRLSFWLLNSEFHCVACYRFGRFAGRLRAAKHPLGGVLSGAFRLWNRWVTHIDHFDLNRYADVGPGLLVMHRHGVVVGPSTIGANCVLHQNVTIGQRVAGGDQSVPRIGNDVWIGPGAVITGDILVGDGCTISAGAFLSRDTPPGCLIGGNPARVLFRDYDRSRQASPRRAGEKGADG